MAKVTFTAGRVAGFKCPADKQQAFLWDANIKGLGLRATPTGKAVYVFQSAYGGKTVRLTIGSPDAWGIPDAQAKARELQRLIDEGTDPRDQKRSAIADSKAKAAAIAAAKIEAAAKALTVGEVWAIYLDARRPHWGARHLADHSAMVRAGGEVSNIGTRGRGVTVAGALHPLMALALSELTTTTVEAWATREAQTRPTSARLAWRCLKAFLSWCAEQPQYAPLLASTNPAKTKKTRQTLGKAGVKQDALLKEQLPGWFAAVRQLANSVASAYLQVLLLTGARPGEVLAMRWEDINTKWQGLTIRDKVEGERVIPLTPYVSTLLHRLPRRNAFVFASSRTSTAIAHPNSVHTSACAVAGIDGLTLHGLRRSFKSLTEWLEIPAGVVAQIQGHKPSATAEKHYTVRPLDLLRLHHQKIEAWILEQAGVQFDTSSASESRMLRLVNEN